ncbi:MAG: TIGR03862 family flavoprotein [Burkholderiaceae bacterium]
MNMQQKVAVIGAGPAGLMAAEVLSAAGVAVDLYDAMPSVGRKFLLAGKGGLNLTHSEPKEIFLTRYGPAVPWVRDWLVDFDASRIRDWAQSLGVSTFVGSSGRVFPQDMKAAPLLRAWLQRLRHPARGVPVQFHMRHRWLGWSDPQTLQFETPQGAQSVQADAVVLALGGASWSRLGSDGAWLRLLQEKSVAVAPLRSANCGFDVEPVWSEHFKTRFAGQAFKSVALSLSNTQGESFHRQGEFVATATGVEGSLIYAASRLLRDEIEQFSQATFQLDLLPHHSQQRVLSEVSHPRGSRSLSSHLKSRLGIDGIKAGLLHELLSKEQMQQAPVLAAAIKALPLRLVAARPIDEAISSAGGVAQQALNADLMLKQLPGVFCCGEMLDWEAPTGGYLLTACLASGRRAGQGALNFFKPDRAAGASKSAL